MPTGSPPDRAVRDRKMRTFLLVTGSIVVLLMTYGSGMRAQKKHVTEIEEQRKRIDQDLRQAQRTLRLRLATVEQLEARRQVSLALTELDKRNFGIAQEKVAEAARLLDLAQKDDTANPDLSAPREALQKTTLAAAADVSGARDALLAIASQMDEKLGAATGRFIEMERADDTSHPILKPTMNDVPAPVGHDVMPR